MTIRTNKKNSQAGKKGKKVRRTGKAAPARQAAKAAGKTSGLRVRMYRVGFGDFFLVTVPGKSGPQHILIDCGVHAGDIGSMDDCVRDLVKETDRKLALVVATHYHADHLSGFASHYDDFAQFEVGAVWITNRLDPKQKKASKFKAQVNALASHLQLRLGARDDEEGQQALFKVQNATGHQHGAKEGGNEKALRLLTSGFKNKPPVFYYQAGDEPSLPSVLKGAITAELLGPPPIDSDGEFSSSDNKKEQYLAAVADAGFSDVLAPFEKPWPASASDYHASVFSEYRTEDQLAHHQSGSHEDLERILHDAQPDELLAMADAVDGTLNNQSLVILFTCHGKKLLFVGDAQWGNWSYWLYGKKVAGSDPGILPKAKSLLGSIDFYKVGHHGSTNANPIPAIAALNAQCASMCSTESGDDKAGYPVRKRPYGKVTTNTEVPRIKLMEEMEKKTKNRLVRSDWLKVSEAPATTEAKGQLAALPANFSTGDVYVDYVFSD
jgi:beta-lactamase superfamily II metal-dependent hydrolase